MEFKTIKELHDAVKSGLIDESKLTIIMDNDNTSFYMNDNTSFYMDEPISDEDFESMKITVKEANGYYDIDKLYTLLFPKATVEWC